MQKLGLFGVRFGGSVFAIQREHKQRGVANAGIGQKGFTQKCREERETQREREIHRRI